MIQGTVAPGFEAVRREFERNFAERGDVGAAVAIYHRGQKVVDLWGGYRDAARRLPWEEHTIVPVFSTTKGLAALATALAHSRGWIDYDERVSTYWPEFAQNGKRRITVRQLLAHQAGLSAIDEPLDLKSVADKERLAAILARQKPAWEPGESQGYHTWSLGWYQSELIRRVDPKHRHLGRFFQEEIARPLGLSFYIGLPSTVPADRLATLISLNGLGMLRLFLGMDHPLQMVKAFANSRSVPARSMLNPKFCSSHANFNRRDVLAVEIPSGNGVGEARAIARAYGVFAAGGAELGLRRETLEELQKPPVVPVNGPWDRVWLTDFAYSLGFGKACRGVTYGSGGDQGYGFWGAGGSAGFADPVAQVGYGYVTNKMGTRFRPDPRDMALREAFYGCLTHVVAGQHSSAAGIR